MTKKNDNFYFSKQLKNYSELNSVKLSKNDILEIFNNIYGMSYKYIHKISHKKDSGGYSDYCLNSNEINLENYFIEETNVYATPRIKNQDPYKNNQVFLPSAKKGNALINNENISGYFYETTINNQRINHLALSIKNQIITKKGKTYKPDLIYLFLTHKLNVGIKIIFPRTKIWFNFNRNHILGLDNFNRNFLVNILIGKLKEELINLKVQHELDASFVGYVLILNLYNGLLCINLKELLENKLYLNTEFEIEFYDFLEDSFFYNKI